MEEKDLANKGDLATVPSPSDTKAQQINNQTAKNSNHIFMVILMLVAGFVAGLGGAWTYGQLERKPISSPLTVNESRQKVITEGEVVADIAKKVSPSVVSIMTESRQMSGFWGEYMRSGAGTGVVISKDGYILTNKHVVPEGINQVKIVTNTGKTYDDVAVVGRDAINDLAFLKIKNVNDLTPAALGDSSNTSVGQKVVAIGNALGQYSASVTSGIVSGKNRSLQASSGDGSSAESLSNLLQTDAAINPGNSGGPLVNINGEVIGINTAISQDAEGIGFAIPIDDAKGLIKSILQTGELKRAYLGVRYITVTPSVAQERQLAKNVGAYVVGDGGSTAVVSGSPAAKAGLKEGDIIIKINDTALDENVVLSSQLAQFLPGETINITVFRDNAEKTLRATLEQYSN